ncbi:MAG: hypothetical protein KIT17_12130 [Rubrivivax sp.]|nr:hypothetical protein [Rubrivivax sp.]
MASARCAAVLRDAVHAPGGARRARRGGRTRGMTKRAARPLPPPSGAGRRAAGETLRDAIVSIFSICATFVAQGELDETLSAMALAETEFTAQRGVLSRTFAQCMVQPHVIWSVTEWRSEKHHHDAAQAIMKTRRDDRIASILCGPEPYFEIFGEEAAELRLGECPASGWPRLVVAHGLIGAKARAAYLRLRGGRVTRVMHRIAGLRVYHNRYNADEFVALLACRGGDAFEAGPDTEGLRLEEYLFTGLRRPLGMSHLASYNQFVCTPLPLAPAGSARRPA